MCRPAAGRSVEVEVEVVSMLRPDTRGPGSTGGAKVLPKAAILSFTLGLLALRVCWLPGVNCALALVALALGIVGLLRILRGLGRFGGIEEAITGLILGIVVLGLSVFFVSALVVAYR